MEYLVITKENSANKRKIMNIKKNADEVIKCLNEKQGQDATITIYSLEMSLEINCKNN